MHFFRSMDNILVLEELWVGRGERSFAFHCVPSILLNFHNKNIFGKGENLNFD